MSQIHLKNLSFNYSDGTRALDGIDLELLKDTKTALVGPNGAGKTSLLLAMAGLINVQGEVWIDHIQMQESSASELRKKMSYIFQNPDEMLFMPTVIEDVSFGLDALGLNKIEIQDRAQEALEMVSLTGFEHRSAHHLSYGERRKVCLATSLARLSSLTLFDEPSRELDPYSRRIFINLFNDMTGTRLLATHDLELVLETCDNMILLDQGRIITQGNPREILMDKSLMEQHRLEVPHSLMKHPHAHQ